MDLDQWLDMAMEGKLLGENDVRKLCELVTSLLVEESNVQPVSSPVMICGDIHGQFYDLKELLRIGGMVPATSYIFLGDFVDRGSHSIETFVLLLCMKARYPQHVTLLRGNHESRGITQVYGFFEEIMNKYGNSSVWKYFTRVFDYLNVAAVVDGKVLCVHGGLSPEIVTIDQIRTIDRVQEIPHEGAFCDLMWSDPEDIHEDLWHVSPRGAGFLFGGRVTSEFNHINNLELVARAHQLVNEGWRYHFPDNNLCTIWSAPNYCYRCGNVAAILSLDEHLEREFRIFKEVKESKLPGLGGVQDNSNSYFL